MHLAGKVIVAAAIGATGFLLNKYRLYEEPNVDYDQFNSESKFQAVSVETTAPRIAVIGSGIGGSSAAHFLRKLLGTAAQIDVYEKSEKIGGRMAIVEVNGNKIECGGTIIHDSNKYMVTFAEELGLQQYKSLENGRIGIYDGNEFLYTDNKYGFINKIQFLWRYGFFSLRNLDTSLKEILKDFVKVYDLQDDGKAFRTVPDMLRAMGGERFVEYTQKTSAEVLQENGVGKLLIDELITAVARCNYGQDTNINAFTGYVSMAGAQGGELWTIKYGNFQVCEKLLEKAKANVFLKQHISSIRKEEENENVVYYLESSDVKTSALAYDAVIVAAPIEVPKCYIQCDKCTDWPNQATLGRYQLTVATFIQAYINFKNLGLENDKNVPSAIFTTENKNLSFSTIGEQKDTAGERIEPPVYKVFSRQVLSNENVMELFDVKNKDYNENRVHISWLAYPKYTPPERFLPFVFDNGVFYVNAIERAASAMEMSAIGGRNAALLTAQYLKKDQN